MICRLGDILDEALDLVRAARALPHVIERNVALELRVIALESQSKALRADVGGLAEESQRVSAITHELYLSPPADAEVPDA